MKRFCMLIIASLASAAPLRAQSVAEEDTLHAGKSAEILPGEELMPEAKSYGGFLLDMNLIKPEASPLPRFTLEIPDASKDYSRLFRLTPSASYSQGFSNVFSLTGSPVYGVDPFGLGSFLSSPDYLQMGSFKLKNGMRMNTYGQYDKDGWRVPNPSALPWEKNNFKGAFEMKSTNGAFGLRIEVQRGNRAPF